MSGYKLQDKEASGGEMGTGWETQTSRRHRHHPRERHWEKQGKRSTPNWRGTADSDMKPYIKRIGWDMSEEQQAKVAHLPPCPFETQFPTLTCLDVNCWNEEKYRHRRQRPQECWYGESCRSYRCLRLHPVEAWKRNLREIKKQKEALYRGKEAEQEEQWDSLQSQSQPSSETTSEATMTSEETAPEQNRSQNQSDSW